MRLAIKINKRLALLFALSLAVFSTGMAIVQQCHPVSSDQIAMQYHYSGAHSLLTVATSPLSVPFQSVERVIDGGCAALFIIALLLSRKYFDLNASRSKLNSFMILGRELAIGHRSQVFQLALTRTQLGVIRV